MTSKWENAVLNEKVRELIRNVLASSPDEVIPDEVIYVGDPSMPVTEDEIEFAKQLERAADAQGSPENDSEKGGRQVQPQPSRERGSDFLRYLDEEVWPKAPSGQLGRRLSREEEDEILGGGSD